jgi:hypothetical protein
MSEKEKGVAADAPPTWPTWAEKAEEFLSTYPLYRLLRVKTPETFDQLASVRPQLRCPTCKDERTFRLSTVDNEAHLVRYVSSRGGAAEWMPQGLRQGIRQFGYECSKCGAMIYFFVVLAGNTMKKVGQLPPWEAQILKIVATFLGEPLAELYGRGIRSESQGYGIGAFAYYRRVVEQIVDRLFDSIAENIDEAREFSAALDAARKERVADKKIAIVKDMLPETLRPDGLNPLDVLHGCLSGGLHNETEEECLDSAANVRVTLEYLIRQLATRREGRKAFSDAQRKLLAKRQKESST